MSRKCTGCLSAEKEGLILLTLKGAHPIQLKMEDTPDGMRLHLSDGEKHMTRAIFFCPFCGREFERKD